MRKRVFSIVLMSVGIILVAVGLLAPLAVMANAAQAAPYAIIGGAEEGTPSLGIIGGADGPTYIYVYTTVNGGIWVTVTALGVLALITGVIVLIAEATKKS